VCGLPCRVLAVLREPQNVFGTVPESALQGQDRPRFAAGNGTEASQIRGRKQDKDGSAMTARGLPAIISRHPDWPGCRDYSGDPAAEQE